LIDRAFLYKILPAAFDDFLFVPSAGASGGILIAWNSRLLSASLKFCNGFALAARFHSNLDDTSWNLTNVYGPCTPEGKLEFIAWLKTVDLSDTEPWMILGDFNLYRRPDNRNREGANSGDMNMFNSFISLKGLTEIPLQGMRYTWSNMQQPPLLEKLDWIFTNNSWTGLFPETTSSTLTKEVSDHCPILVTFSS